MVRVKRLAVALLWAVFVQACGSGGHEETAPPGSSGTGSLGGGGSATAGLGGTLAGMGGATAGIGANAGAGAGGGAGGMAGGDGGSTGSPFVAVAPCNLETDYVSAPTTVTWEAAHLYTPACLKVTVGASVTFSGSFNTHPLAPSAMRGTLEDNPILKVKDFDGDRTFTFSSPGFFAYWCTFHGSDTTGANMTGVIWVE